MWGCGGMGMWGNGDVRYGDVRVWGYGGCGNVRMWECGDLGVWGDVRMWGDADVGMEDVGG